MAHLSELFTGIAAKRLSIVETDIIKSNQHEFNGIRDMACLFGEEKISLDTKWLYLGDSEEETISHEGGRLTWYDARANHPKRTEYRLYFQSNAITELAKEGDLLVLAKRADDTVLAIVVKQHSTFERQVAWLFGIVDEDFGFAVNRIVGDKNKAIGFTERTILETIGIEVEQKDDDYLDLLLESFGEQFPKTSVFSQFARKTLPGVSSLDDPDTALMAWMDQEELLFRTLEKHIVEKRLQANFEDVDSFISFSLSVHNRRKSRVGYALENHIQQVFEDHVVTFSRGKETENRSKPDFIFPSIESYHDITFPDELLTMLGSKSTCKDRWRQVLSEARKIKEKHLLTLEPGISLNQTEEMQASGLQLVIPTSIHSTYSQAQQDWLMSFTDFIRHVQEKCR